MISKTITGLFAILIFTLLSLSSFAAWINSIPQTIVQPDGSTIECFATGDEFYNWLHNENGYTIIQNQETGYYSYAILEDNKLVSSNHIVGQADPSSIGLSPWINITGEQMKAKRSEFLKNQMPPKPQIQGFKMPGSVKNAGTLNNLTVYIRFSDQLEFSQDTMFYWNMFNNESPGYNSMVNYFEDISYEQLTLPSWFYPVPSNSTVVSYQDIYERSYFMPYSVSNPNGYQDGERTTREHQLLVRAINYIEEEVSEEIDLDFNSDGYVDNVVFIVKGATTAWSTLLWPHRWSLYSETVYINGKRVWDYNFQLENSLNSSGVGVLCHEMGHSLSAPDLYHYNSTPYTPVGPWDIMASDQNPPQSMGAYMKYRYGGWIDDIPEITECGTYTLNPVSNPENNCFKIASPNSNTDYYVIEYRLKEGTFESSLPGSGLLVYRINSLQNGNGNAQGPPDELYLYRPGGTISTNGSINSANFAADYNRTEINDNTNPYPFLSNGQAGGLDISNIGFIGETITFDVTLELEPVADFESSDLLITEGCSVDFTDLSLCNVDEWEWTFEGGTPSSSTDQHPQGVTYQSSGTYSVTLVASNEYGENTLTKSAYIEVSTTSIPEVIFFASDSAVCTGSTVMFTDYSTICPESWSWEITPTTFSYVNGTSAASQNPEVEFSEVGAYSVNLTVTNANGSNFLNKNNYIIAGGSSFPFFEDFEAADTELNGWSVVNPDNDNTTWELFSVAGNGGNKAAGIDLFNYIAVLKRDQLISPPIDLSGTSQAVLTFDHAYALFVNPDWSDSLIVKISGDCGNSWTRIMELADDGTGIFATHPPSSMTFIPATADDWCGSGYGSNCLETDISAWAGMPNVKIMFESLRFKGNNLYIDNVSVNISTSITGKESEATEQINVFPNPSNGKIITELSNSVTQGKMMIYNSNGSVVFESVLDNNQKRYSNDLSVLPKGMYIIRIIGLNFNASEKVMIK